MSTAFDLSLPENCPLAGATPQVREVFRCVKNDPPTPDDLLTHLELGLAPTADPCRRASVSLYSTYTKAKHRLDMSPHLGTHIASATLQAEHGPTSNPAPNSGHFDWWPYAGMRRPTDFQVVRS